VCSCCIRVHDGSGSYLWVYCKRDGHTAEGRVLFTYGAGLHSLMRSYKEQRWGIRLQMWAPHTRKTGPTGNVTAHIDVHRQTLAQRHCNCMVNLLVRIAEAGDLHLQHNKERHIVICSLIATWNTLCNVRHFQLISHGLSVTWWQVTS
jgi:hypothetical protein